MRNEKKMKMTQKQQKIHADALQSFDRAQSACYQERLQNLQDRRFCWIASAQWEGWGSNQFENKPRPEINKVQLAVTRINNEYRANRISVLFVPSDGGSETETESLNDIFRSQSQANGSEWVDNAFIEAVSGGIGAWRLRAEYEDEYDEENERQKICFEPVFDADTSVYFDLGAKKQNKSDATECWVIYSIPTQDYEDQYDSIASWPKLVTPLFFDWYTPDVVYVAEYYKVEEDTDTIHWFGGLVDDEKKITHEEYLDQEVLADLEATGYKELRQKKVKRRRVHKYLMSGGGIIEDYGLISGPNIPVIITYGKRLFIDNIERASGHIRPCKDSQRLYNMQAGKLAEISALSSVEKPIFFPAQVMGHETRWALDNIENYPYLLINPMTDQNGQLVPTGQVGSTKSPEIPPAMAALLQLTGSDLNDLLGNQQAGEVVQANTSGLAIELTQAKIDMQTSGYLTNLEIAMEWCGHVWLGMAKEIFVESGRKIKGVKESGAIEQIELMQPIIDDKTGDITTQNDFSHMGKLDVIVTTGPKSASKRAATEKGLLNLMGVTQDPETQAALSGLILANSEGEGMAEARPYFRKKLINLGVIKPTEEEAQQLMAEQQAAAQQQRQPDANQQFLQASAMEAEAKAENYKAQTLKVLAEVAETRANTDLILANTQKSTAQSAQIETSVDQSKRQHFIDVVTRLEEEQDDESEEISGQEGQDTEEPEEPEEPENEEQPGQTQL